MGNYRTQKQWFDLITQCRQSGMTDMEWCRVNGISRSTFYKALSRLRTSACKLPEPSRLMEDKLDLTSNAKQEVVPIKIIPDVIVPATCSADPAHATYAMEITAGRLVIRIGNDIDSSLLSTTLRMLGGIS